MSVALFRLVIKTVPIKFYRSTLLKTSARHVSKISNKPDLHKGNNEPKPKKGTLVAAKEVKGFGDVNFHPKELLLKEPKKSSTLYRNEVKKVNRYVFSKFFDYIQNYNQLLEKRFPKTVKAYRYFMDGVSNFFLDMKIYLSVIRKLTGSGKVHVSKLTRREMEIYYYMPSEMRKAAPALILAALPGVFYAILPLAYMYPGFFLTHHFWSEEEKVYYRSKELLKRLQHNRPIFRALQCELDKFTEHPLHENCEAVLGMLGSGIHPSANQVLDITELFKEKLGPYSLERINSAHIMHLLRCHNLHLGFYRKKRLERCAWTIVQMDRAIIREGGACVIKDEDLVVCAYLRGLNATKMKPKAIRQWLHRWVKVSSSIDDKDSSSLLLHCPIFLAYNHPHNWASLHGKTKK